MSPMSRRTYAILAVVLAAIFFVALNMASNALLTTARLDLTENGQFTLAQGTRNVIDSLKEPITLKFFFSKKVAADYAQTEAYAGRVRDLLREYAALSHGNIVLEEIDPEPFTPEEDEANADGLTPAPTDTGEQVYFGLVGTNRIDGKEAIAYFSPDREPYLEYDLTSLVYRLSAPKKPVIGILSSLPLDTGAGGMAAALQGQAQPFAIYQEIAQSYKTEMIDASFHRLPSDIDVLLIAHPGNLTTVQQYAIEQFVLNGGRALVFVDPMSEIAQTMGGGAQGGAEPTSDLPALFRSWGIAYDANKVIGDKALAQRVQTSTDERNPVASYPIWLHLTAANFNGKDPVTANLQSLNLASAGALHHLGGAATTFTPLVASSDQSALLDAAQVRFMPRPQDLMSTILPTGEKYVIAARVSGIARSVFPNGPPVDMTPVPAGTPAPAPFPAQIKVAKSPINVIVMADSDIFDDRFWVHVADLYGHKVAAPFADNAAFVLNAIENLTGSGDLIDLRTRASSDRPFTVVKALQAQAQAQFQEEAEALQQRLTDTQQRLHELQQGGSATGAATDSTALSPQQQATIQRFQRELVATRSQLRDVQHNLRKDIDLLGSVLAFINIALVPILVAGFAVILAWLRRRRRARALAL